MKPSRFFFSLCGLFAISLSGCGGVTAPSCPSSAPWGGTLQRGALPGEVWILGAGTDSNCNVFTAGTSTVGIGGNTLTGLYDLILMKTSAAGVVEWTVQAGVAGKNTVAQGVGIDSDGNSYIAGETNGGPYGNTLTGDADAFLGKYDSSGTKVWYIQFGVASETVSGAAVAVDSSNNIFVAGYTTGALHGNSLVGTQDFFVAKFDSSGTRQWTRQLGVPTESTSAKAVAVDPAGNVYVGGETRGALDGGTLTGFRDFFVTKYDTSGTKLWTVQLGAAATSIEANSLAVDASGNVYVTGRTFADLDGQTFIGFEEMFATKYNSSGVKQWTVLLGVAASATQGQSVAIDVSGNLLVTGYTWGAIAPNTLTGAIDLLLAKFDSSGTLVWARQLGAAGKDTLGYGVTSDLSGGVLVTGVTNGGLDGNAGSGNYDYFLAKYNASGELQ